ncbi:MAG: rRNA pseudouridine synthase [Planctomycetes bacterium]|nr:rRNA pseudouridine synthase [Planctomycetota bacterium]
MTHSSEPLDAHADESANELHEAALEPADGADAAHGAGGDGDDDDDEVADAGAGADAGEGELVRLNKYLADRGIASRRKCDELITAGAVSIDGKVVTELGTKVDPTTQTVEVAGEVLKPEGPSKRYYLLNKPRGVVCTNEEREPRMRAIDMITDPKKGRIYTVGRLDEESQGLILLTNDGEFANVISHPRHGVPKTYWAKIRGRVDDEALRELEKGVFLAEGRTHADEIKVEKRTAEFTALTIVLREGKNREVRRMFAKVGFKVLQLRRVRIGNLTDRYLREGDWRPLTRAEVEDLKAVAVGDAPVDPIRSRAKHKKGFSRARGPKHGGERRRSGGLGRHQRGEARFERRGDAPAARAESGAREFGERRGGSGGFGRRERGAERGAALGTGRGAGRDAGRGTGRGGARGSGRRPGGGSGRGSQRRER